MSVYVGFIRPGGLNATWAFFNLVFINNLCILLCNYYSIKVDKTGVNKKNWYGANIRTTSLYNYERNTLLWPG